MIRYYGYYSDRLRGDRKKKKKDDEVPDLMDSEVCSKQLRRSWARLIHKIGQVDPLVCQKCQAPMRIISFIEQECIIEKILRHLGLSQSHNHDPPIGNATDISEFIIDYDHSQVAPIDYWLQ